MTGYIFRHFAPMTGEVGNYLIPSLGPVVMRTRALLKYRSDREVDIAVDNAIWFIKDFSVRTIDSLGDDDQDAFDDLTDLERLREGICDYDLHADTGLPMGEAYEYFAAWAIYSASRALDEWTREYDQPAPDSSIQEHVRGAREIAEVKAYSAGRYMVEAMDAVCYAEALKSEAKLSARFQTLHVLDKFSLVPKLIEDKARELISVQARSNALAGRKPNHENKQKVWAWCEENLNNYKKDTEAARAAERKNLFEGPLSTYLTYVKSYKKSKAAG